MWHEKDLGLINQKIWPNQYSSISVDCLEVNEEKISDSKIIMNTFGDYFSIAGSKLASSLKSIPEPSDLDDFVPSRK